MPPLGVLIVLCGLFGLAIGSFLNVVICRVPRHESVVTPPSACPSCGTQIEARDNIPVVSWMLLRGRCRHCSVRISWQYPVVELLTAGLFAGLAARFGWNWALPAYLALFAGLVALSWIDVELMLLPKAIVYPTLGIVSALLLLASATTSNWRSMWVAAICAAGWWMFFWALNFLSPRLLGYGDVRLAPVLGLGLGWLGVRYVILGFFVANLIGALIGVGLMVAQKVERQQRIPYGVFLAMGVAIAVFWGPEILRPFESYRI